MKGDSLSQAIDTKITLIEATRLDRLIQILEIAFIFLLSFSLITLVDAAFVEIDLYEPIVTDFLGQEGYGSLDGGNFEQIVRITLIFNLLLFTFSLFFGLWIRKTRDGWTWSQLGYTYRTDNYGFSELVLRSILLGLIAVVVFFTVITPIVFFDSDSMDTAILFHAYHSEGQLFTSNQLNAEYYFGFIEMGFIWPLSAGFFFFAYCHNSLKARFSTGIANLLSSAFYVTYLAFFFILAAPGKLDQLPDAVEDPIFWGMLIALFIVLYIFFSAFAETESVVLPFAANFVFNVGLTLIRGFNALNYSSVTELMLLPYFLIVILIALWYFVRKNHFSTIRLGLTHLKQVFSVDTRKETSVISLIGLVTLFFILTVLIPSVLEHIMVHPDDFTKSDQAFTYAFMYFILIGLAVIVLTYEPTNVYDVLVVKHPDGIPIAMHSELWQSDEALISGFFSAVSTVSQELESEETTTLRSVKLGEREIIIEDGVFSRIIALADRDQASIRQSIIALQRSFESRNSKKLAEWLGDPSAIPEANELVDETRHLSIIFDIPQQTRWLVVLTLFLTPLMIGLIGLI